jgi:benzoyl-CoA reductase/2-hydroxyglutaryl-CoA dehydratase subunit BcrC/BadD/HgdB
MAIREKAMKSSAFTALKKIYDNRESYLFQWKENNGKVVGTMGCDVPDEILLSAGYLPVRVYGGKDMDLDEADKYLEFSFDPLARSHFQKLIDGTYGNLFDRLVISNSTDMLVRLYLYLREIHHIEPEKPVPPIYFIDWLFTRSRIHQIRNERTINKFKKEVESWTGTAITDIAIKKASTICNENREALAEFSKLRRGENRTVNGSEALVVIGSSLFMDKKEHTSLVKELITEAEQWDEISGPSIFFTGSVQEDIELYSMIEEAGASVVSEDHDWGNRHFDRHTDTGIDAVKGIVDRYMLRQPSSKKSFVSQRVELVKELMGKSNADGVLFFMRNYEDAPSWDYPEQAKAIEEMSKLHLYIGKQSLDISNNEETQVRIKEFVDSLKGVPCK